MNNEHSTVNNDKKVWLLQVLSERSYHLAKDIAMEASRHGNSARGFAVIADELIMLSNRLLGTVEELRFGKGVDMKVLDDRIADSAKQTELITLNAAIEAVNSGGPVNEGKAFLICVEELRKLAVEIQNTLYEGSQNGSQNMDIPVISEPSTVSGDNLFLLSFSIDGLRFAENIKFIQEVLYFPEVRGFIDNDGMIALRNVKMHVIDCYQGLGLKRPLKEDLLRLVVLNLPWAVNRHCAVIVDAINVNAIFASPLGRRADIKDMGIDVKFIRECWDTKTGGQLMFIDWDRLAAI